ncbi:hypothetical protein CCH79_00006687 [Gambusia affinis]|uniref:Uncharacterized protein n=1 Tax=Gambusia affinis TaxID=33528 RepID=A0A315W7B9_GAMAF|nr:hypothetical protein CCH79_00006687 [Gambusia affinis]
MQMLTSNSPCLIYLFEILRQELNLVEPPAEFGIEDVRPDVVDLLEQQLFLYHVHIGQSFVVDVPVKGVGGGLGRVPSSVHKGVTCLVLLERVAWCSFSLLVLSVCVFIKGVVFLLPVGNFLLDVLEEGIGWILLNGSGVLLFERVKGGAALSFTTRRFHPRLHLVISCWIDIQRRLPGEGRLCGDKSGGPLLPSLPFPSLQALQLPLLQALLLRQLLGESDGHAGLLLVVFVLQLTQVLLQHGDLICPLSFTRLTEE